MNIPTAQRRKLFISGGTMNETEYVTTQFAARLLDITTMRVSACLRDGVLRGTKLGSTWLIKRSDIEEYLLTRNRKGGRRREPAVKNKIVK